MKVGIIDDDLSLAQMLAENLEQETEITDQPEKVEGWVQNGEIDCLVSDLKMPGKSGLKILEEVKEMRSEFPVVMITGHGSVSSAVEAMKQGAYDYFQKPVSNEELQVIIDRIEAELERQNQLEGLRVSQQDFLEEEKIIGTSGPIRRVKEMIEKVAPRKASVLVEGETGTGKELIARALHTRGPRAKAPLIVLNCAAIPPDLLESELFGHVKGAFTGAEETRKGKVELADGGTLFLDEIGEMPLELQPKLLRVLEQEEVTRVGGDTPRSVDIRVVTATNQDLNKLIEEKEFRKDLLYRVNTIQIEAPPLREHPADIPLLIDYFVGEKGKIEFTSAALEALKDYSWPGNVRELKNVIERLVILVEQGPVGTDDLPEEIINRSGSSKTSLKNENISWHKYGENLSEALENIERQVIQQTLKNTGENKAEAARQLGISRQNLHYKLEKLDLA